VESAANKSVFTAITVDRRATQHIVTIARRGYRLPPNP
jgi:hypothetical protein